MTELQRAAHGAGRRPSRGWRREVNVDTDPLAPQLDRSAFEVDFRDDFDGDALGDRRWIPHYLPQWTTPDRSAARFDFDGQGLKLRIDAQQPAWRIEDGDFRVSNIQTGAMSGPVGSSVGTHRYPLGVEVRTDVGVRRLYTPSQGLVEVTVQASTDPSCMLAVWLVGFEESSPDDSGEICVAELFGSEISPERSRVRLGVKAINDPRLVTDVVDIDLPMDAAQRHTYGAAWSSDRVHFYVDGRLVRTVDQGLAYPMQLMIDLFEFPGGAARDPSSYPKTAHVNAVRGYRHRQRAG